jgi:DNA (cytosine-5)-methyltransferase 1
MKRFTCVRLFCGCGGFALGMERAGFTVLAAIDSNPEATQVMRRNLESCHPDPFAVILMVRPPCVIPSPTRDLALAAQG